MRISLLLLALVAGGIAANIDDPQARGEAVKGLEELDQEIEDFIDEDDEDEEEDEFDEEDEGDEQTSLVNFLQGQRAGVCAGKSKGGCKKAGGECVTAPFADNCKAIHGDAGKLKKNACKGKDCQCCAPPPTCNGKIKKSCSKEGGYCVLKPFKSNCKGGTLNKKSCKSKHCQCCIPATTGGTGGNKDTTVKPETTQPPQTTGRQTTPPAQTTTLPPQTTTAPPPPTTLANDPSTAPPAPTTTPPAPTTTPPAPTTTPRPPTTTPPAPTTTPPAPTTTPPAPTTTPPPPTTTPPAPTTTPPAPTTTPPPPPTTTPPAPTTTPPPPTTTPPAPTTTPPPPTTTPPPPTTTPPPPPTTLRPVPKDRLLPSIVIRDETAEWTQGWFSKKKVTYTLVMARGYGDEEEFIYIQKDKFSKGYTLDTLINVCDLQYGTYKMTNGRKGVFMVYHDTSLKPYQKRFKLNSQGITQDILNAVGQNIDSENFPGTSTSSSFWDFSWLTGDYLKDVKC